jgi:hypothetical protein
MLVAIVAIKCINWKACELSIQLPKMQYIVNIVIIDANSHQISSLSTSNQSNKFLYHLSLHTLTHPKTSVKNI